MIVIIGRLASQGIIDYSEHTSRTTAPSGDREPRTAAGSEWAYGPSPPRSLPRPYIVRAPTRAMNDLPASSSEACATTGLSTGSFRCGEGSGAADREGDGRQEGSNTSVGTTGHEDSSVTTGLDSLSDRS